MNVSGVGATPPAPPLPPVAPPAPAAPAAATDPRTPSGTVGQRADRRPEQPGPRSEADAAPPLRVLTVTEMRVMLGQLPASAAIKAASEVQQPHARAAEAFS